MVWELIGQPRLLKSLMTVEIIDWRTIAPIDETFNFESANKHGKCLVLTEEPVFNGFALESIWLVFLKIVSKN